MSWVRKCFLLYYFYLYYPKIRSSNYVASRPLNDVQNTASLMRKV